MSDPAATYLSRIEDTLDQMATDNDVSDNAYTDTLRRLRDSLTASLRAQGEDV